MSHTEPKMEGILNNQAIQDRRKAHRFDASTIHDLKIIIRGNEYDVSLISISRTGALIEWSECMSPDSSIFLRLLIEKTTYSIKGRIIRSVLSSTKNKELQYLSAIAFDKDFMLLPACVDTD